MMIKQLLLAATVAASLSPFAFGPASARTTTADGHYEWQPARQQGPRAPLQAPVRIWVPDRAANNVAMNGQYELRTVVQPGPRAVSPAVRRVWVPDPVSADGQSVAITPGANSPVPIG